MLTLATKTLEAQGRHLRIMRWAVSYRLRYWDVNAQAFTFTGSWTALPRSEVIRIGSARDALDRGDINEFKASNVTIELRNKRNKWSIHNPGGYFKADATARIGYEQQLMEFKVEMFYEHVDGTESAAIPIFVGHASLWDFYPKSNSVAITLESKHVLLRRGDAEKVSNIFTATALVGTVNGVNLVFTTSHLGVGRMTNVYVDGVVKRAGIDYTVSNLNIHNLSATITFIAAPVAPQVVTADYTQWKRDQKIDQLVRDLATQAGIASGDQVVSPVVFSNRVINTNTKTSQADFEAFTRTNIDTRTASGEMRRAWFKVDDFSDGDFTANPVWTPTVSPGASLAVSGGKLTAVSPGFESAIASLAFSKAYGTWEFKLSSSLSGGGIGVSTAVRFVKVAPFTGYLLLVAHFSSTVLLCRQDGGGLITLASLGASDASEHTWRITRSDSGEFKVYKDGVLTATVTDTTYTTGSAFDFQNGSQDGTVTSTFDDFYWSPGVIDPTIGANPAINDSTAVAESVVIDGTAGFGDWSSISHAANIPAGTSVLIETATADESSPGSGVPGTFEAYTALGPSGTILSTQLRFLKYRVTLSATAFPDFATPSVLDFTTVFITTTTTIRMANFLGLTCFDAIQRLGEIANYEWGFDRSGKLFFRARDISSSVDLTVTMRRVLDITRISDGLDRVFNQVRASYGSYDKTVDSVTQNDSRPNSFDRYGFKRLSIGASQILVDPDADIATGLAISYYNLFSQPRLRYEVVVDFLPQLELSDTVKLEVADSLPNPPWHIGDTAQAVGDTDIHLFSEAEQSAFGVVGRVLAVQHDPSGLTTRLELERIN